MAFAFLFLTTLLLYTASATVLPLSSRTDALLVAHDLGKILSSKANITLPSDSRWDLLIARASYPRVSPNYQVIVEVGEEKDVSATIRYASRKKIDFLTVAGGHGETKSLNGVECGIQINMRKLNFATVGRDNTATIGGGALQWEVTSELFKQGKQAVTGICECVSAIGPLLGGGHSLLQSQYGFALDNLISVRLVLADGTIVDVSRTRNADLFWALRGAGHNFGVVTSFKVKLYDAPPQYQLYSLLFQQDKLEPLFNLINEIDSPTRARDPKLFINGVLTRIPSGAAVFNYTIIYPGTKAQLEAHAKPFLDIGPSFTKYVPDLNYGNIYVAFGQGKSSGPCMKNTNQGLMGVALPKWDIEGMKKAYTIYQNLTADPRFPYSFILLENYGIVNVKTVDPDSVSLPREERERPILASPVITYRVANDQTKNDASDYSSRIKDALYMAVDASNGKVKRHAYVNYASGLESVPEIYGYEQWKIDKLKKLKKKWDPNNRFRFYNPLV